MRSTSASGGGGREGGAGGGGCRVAILLVTTVASAVVSPVDASSSFPKRIPIGNDIFRRVRPFVVQNF